MLDSMLDVLPWKVEHEVGFAPMLDSMLDLFTSKTRTQSRVHHVQLFFQHFRQKSWKKSWKTPDSNIFAMF